MRGFSSAGPPSRRRVKFPRRETFKGRSALPVSSQDMPWSLSSYNQLSECCRSVLAGQVEFGVFKALVDANQQQLHSYVELIQNVAASTAGFADANVGLVGARRWLVERFPGSFTVEGESDGFDEPGQPLSPEDQAQRDAGPRRRVHKRMASLSVCTRPC
jgi:hypothetical protein